MYVQSILSSSTIPLYLLFTNREESTVNYVVSPGSDILVLRQCVYPKWHPISYIVHTVDQRPTVVRYIGNRESVGMQPQCHPCDVPPCSDPLVLRESGCQFYSGLTISCLASTVTVIVQG